MGIREFRVAYCCAYTVNFLLHPKMALRFQHYLTVVVPQFFLMVALHSDNIFTTLVFYNSMCIQELDESLHSHCKNLENFTKAENHIQKLAAGWVTAMNIGTAIPSVIACILIGKTLCGYFTTKEKN